MKSKVDKTLKMESKRLDKATNLSKGNFRVKINRVDVKVPKLGKTASFR